MSGFALLGVLLPRCSINRAGAEMATMVHIALLLLLSLLCAHCLPTVPLSAEERISQQYDYAQGTESDETLLHQENIFLSETLHLPRVQRAVTNGAIHLWENATIPYAFDANFPPSARKKVLKAFSHWRSKTCIRFIPHSIEKFFIVFKMSYSSCSSFIGRFTLDGIEPIYRTGQPIYLTQACAAKRGNIIHELGHAIGFWHEHTRPDRDDYIRILWENINETFTDNFKVHERSEIDSLGVPYDLGSIMHYQLNAYSKNGLATIEVLPNVSFDGVIGQRDHLSEYDRRQANLLYSCHVGERGEEEEVTPMAESLTTIRAGNEIAFKATGTSRLFWMGCTEEGCSLNGCPGNRFRPEKREECPENIFTLHRLDGEKILRVGDEVILRRKLNSSMSDLVYCGSGQTCRLDPICNINEEFDPERCMEQVLVINVPSKQHGEVLKHKDEIVLLYTNHDNRSWSRWISCDLSGQRNCHRSVCQWNSNRFEVTGSGGNTPEDSGCHGDQFIVYKL